MTNNLCFASGILMGAGAVGFSSTAGGHYQFWVFTVIVSIVLLIGAAIYESTKNRF